MIKDWITYNQEQKLMNTQIAGQREQLDALYNY